MGGNRKSFLERSYDFGGWARRLIPILVTIVGGGHCIVNVVGVVGVGQGNFVFKRQGDDVVERKRLDQHFGVRVNESRAC